MLLGIDGSQYYMTQLTLSNVWQIQDVRIVCDVVTLRLSSSELYAEHVLSGKALPINYGTYISQFQSKNT
jgi:hypothetical protein